MSVQKLTNLSVTIIQSTPYAQICNEVTNHIKDNDAYRLYCFLYSKTTDWTVVKEYTRKVCGVSEAKAKKCWSYLARCALIQYVAQRDAQGKLLKYDVVVLNGSHFNKDEPFINEKHDDMRKTQWVDNPPTGEPTRMENDRLLKKDLTKEIKSNKSSCASDDDARDRFDEFWTAYPKKKDKMRAKKVWCRLKLSKKADMIIEDIENRKKNDPQWQDLQYIPNPSTYLSGERWEDDIIKPSPKIQTPEPEVKRASTFFSGDDYFEKAKERDRVNQRKSVNPSNSISDKRLE